MQKILGKIFKGFMLVLLVAVIATGLAVTYPKYDRLQGLRSERDQLLQRIEEKKREFAAIREKQRRFRTDREFVETLARENRKVFPNELVFVFEE